MITMQCILYTSRPLLTNKQNKFVDAVSGNQLKYLVLSSIQSKSAISRDISWRIFSVSSCDTFLETSPKKFFTYMDDRAIGRLKNKILANYTINISTTFPIFS